jgi:hypothetical protein
MITGHCECGRVSFEADGAITDFSHCHCGQCRRLHGAAFATFARVPRDGFRYLRGDGDIKVYASSESFNRVFCAECGSMILCDVRKEPEVLYLSMSAIDGNPPHPTGYHQWVGSKAPWHDISDGLVQYREWPDDR